MDTGITIHQMREPGLIGSPAKREMLARLSLIYSEAALGKAEEAFLNDIRLQPLLPQGAFVTEQMGKPDHYIGSDYSQTQYEIDHLVHRLLINNFHYYADPFKARGAHDVRELFKRAPGILKAVLKGSEKEKFFQMRDISTATREHAYRLKDSIAANVVFMSDYRL